MSRALALVLSAAFLAAAPAVSAQFVTAPKTYVILANAMGRGSTVFTADLQRLGALVQYDLQEIGVVVAASTDFDFARKAKRLRGVHDVGEDSVASAPPRTMGWDGPSSAAGVNSEPNAGLQWNLRQIGADLTAMAGFRGQNAVVAVVDSGINTRHPELGARIDFARSRAFVKSLVPSLGGAYAALPDWEDDHGHGSHVSGIIAAEINNYGIQGVAPEATIVAIKVLGADNTSPSSRIIAGIHYAASLSPDVINLSLGHTFDHAAAGGGGVLLSAYTRAVTYATASGALVVAGAMNEGADLNSRLMATPAQLGTVMAVAATAPDDRPASYTNYGQSVVDIAAPGGDIVNPATYPFEAVYSTWSSASPQLDAAGHIVRDPATGQPVLEPLQPGAGWFRFAWGTSMAAPHVSAAAALLVGRLGRTHPAKLQAILEGTAVDILKPGADEYSGRGRLDAAAALGLR